MFRPLKIAVSQRTCKSLRVLFRVRKNSLADGVSWDEDVDPVEGSDVEFVGGE